MVSLLVAGLMQSALVIPNPHVLVFSKTTGFRHDSIPNAVAAIKKLGTEHDFQVDATEDATVFNDENLKKYDLICFASTTGTILDANQKRAMERFVESGKGWMGIHSASDTEYDWPWYAELVGAYFKSHPPGGQRVHVKIENRGNPSTNGLPNLWIRPDEWYDWQANPRSKVQVLASLDESYYRPENPQDHPIAWCHWQGKGRAWYTEMGHFKEAYSEPIFVSHLYGGLMWAAQGSRRPDGADDLNSSKSYGTSQFHTEFKLAKGSRSSISFDGNAKVHLADSTGKAWDKLADTDCGGVTGNAPSSNAFAGTENWNVLDVVFEGNGSKFVEVRLNGVVVQKNVTVDGVAPIRRRITLGTGSVQYRNTWVKGLNK
ncbi:MAG: ThuA domain-containing protein [Armatimonadota bacterium]